MRPPRKHHSNMSRHRQSHMPNGTVPFNFKSYFENEAYIFYGYVGPVITVFVIIMNVLLIATIIKGKFRTSTHAVMIAIAFADILTGIIPVPFNVIFFSVNHVESFLKIEWCYIFEICQIILPAVFHLISLSLTVALSIERFFVVSFPLKVKRFCTMKNGILFSISVIVASVCAQIDTFLDVSYEPVEIISRNRKFTLTGCRRLIKTKSDEEFITRMFILRFIPCILLIIFTILLLRKSSDIQKWRKQSTSTSSTTASLERMDFAVSLIASIACVTELVTASLLLNEHLNSQYRITPSNALLSGIIYVAYMTVSPINLAILCFLSEKFRQTFKEMFCRH
ncbi:unnamed protein product [Mytilus coruscus]|uniref:G-protein coupled receptors family 1 profile domain-containing protein n=1 Tax=Mytilus coruscus TaxID=42192 RepID=A0A6J8CM80_MYTCO|nr:unnamed protein product [Mytilus coruscus]